MRLGLACKLRTYIDPWSDREIGQNYMFASTNICKERTIRFLGIVAELWNLNIMQTLAKIDRLMWLLQAKSICVLTNNIVNSWSDACLACVCTAEEYNFLLTNNNSKLHHLYR